MMRDRSMVLFFGMCLMLVLQVDCFSYFKTKANYSPYEAFAVYKPSILGRRSQKATSKGCIEAKGSENESLMNVAVIIVDHGSKRSAANNMLEEVSERFKSYSGREIVEVAHMEIAEPSISQAFDQCVARGADAIVVHPFFLSPGKHATKDIPALVEEAAARHPDIKWSLAKTMGLHPLMSELIDSSVNDAISGEIFQSSLQPVNTEIS